MKLGRICNTSQNTSAATAAAAERPPATSAAAQRVAAADASAKPTVVDAAAEARRAAVVHAAWLAAVQRKKEKDAKAKQPSVTVPDDVAAFLRSLSLSAHATALCELGVTSIADLVHVSDAMLRDELPALRPVERAKLIAAVAAAPVSTPAPAAALGVRPRVRALCVGVDTYNAPVPGKLSNCVSDATAVHKALSALPGATATLVINCTKVELEQALQDFRDNVSLAANRGMRVTAAAPASSVEVSEQTLGVVFFAGHGLQVSGRNYLVPADFSPPKRNDKLEPMLSDTARACVSLDLVEEVLQHSGVEAAAVWLDCCRNVPDFLAAAGAARSAGGGTRALPAGMESARTSLPNLMLTFATAPGDVAQDRSTRLAAHSPFTAALLKALSAPLRLNDLNPFLTDEVVADSGGKQRPHVGGTYGVSAGNLLIG
jgi:uncharacterized caspase-like protein